MAREEYECQNQDKFPRDVVAKLIDATNYVLDISRFVAWDEGKMRNWWRGRPLRDLLENPEINHLFPCLDTAALATSHLARKGENVYLKVLTERGATEAFRQGKARIMHIDSLVELVHNGIPYGLDIGCGDITILKPTDNPILYALEQEYYTTRPEKGGQIWRRTPFLRVKGVDLINNDRLSPLDFLNTPQNLVKVPYGISKEDFYTSRDVRGKENILKTNEEGYSPEGSRSSNREWLDVNKEFLPNLKEFQYE